MRVTPSMPQLFACFSYVCGMYISVEINVYISVEINVFMLKQIRTILL